MKRISVLAVVAAILAAGVAGCSEREQTVRYENGKYRGKPDSRPWDSAPLAYGSTGWTKGDHETWENQVRSRQQAQNENRRIGH